MFSERSIKLMTYLERTGGATSFVAAQDLGLDRGTVAGMIHRMESYGMIYRQPNDRNYRTVFSAAWNWREIVQTKDAAHKSHLDQIRIVNNKARRKMVQERIRVQEEQMLHRAIKQNSVFSLGSL